jgi:hypothetical protein
VQKIAIVATLLFALFVAGGPIEARAAGTLTGPMSVMNDYLGTWNCTDTVPAFGSRPSRTVQVTIVYEVVPGNVVHARASAVDYAGDDYYGYSDEAQTYWDVRANSSGMQGSSTSSDGLNYSGSINLGPVAFAATSAYGKVASGRFTASSVLSTQGQQLSFVSQCRR